MRNPPVLDVDPRRLRPEHPPVLLLGGLDLLRPLGFAGIPAIVASPDPGDPALASRYCSGRGLLPPLENREAAALLAAGDRLSSALGRRVPLFYGNDDFEALARNRGLAVPRTLFWDETGADALGCAQGPVIVKPRVKMGWDSSAVHLRLFGGDGKARIFENGRQVMEHPLAILLRDHLTFQEYIPRGDRQLWSFHGLADENGELLAWFIGRKLRTFPALTGMSTFLEAGPRRRARRDRPRRRGAGAAQGRIQDRLQDSARGWPGVEAPCAWPGAMVRTDQRFARRLPHRLIPRH